MDIDSSIQSRVLNLDPQVGEETSSQTGPQLQNSGKSSQATLSIQPVSPFPDQTVSLPAGARPEISGGESDFLAVGNNEKPPEALSTTLTPPEGELTAVRDYASSEQSLANSRWASHDVTENVPHRISIQIFRDGILQDQRESLTMDRFEVERFVKKQLRKKMILVTKYARALIAKNCFDAVVDEGRLTITLILYNEFDITYPLIASMEHQHRSGANEEENQRKKRKIINVS
jgi:hypothetical protein